MNYARQEGNRKDENAAENTTDAEQVPLVDVSSLYQVALLIEPTFLSNKEMPDEID